MEYIKYIVTFSLMFLVIFGMFILNDNSTKSLKGEIMKNEKVIFDNDSLIKYFNKNLTIIERENLEKTLYKFEEKLEKNDVNMEELIIDKYIDYTSYLVAGIAVIMTVMILFTFRDFERLDQLKEQYVNKIGELGGIKSDIEKKFESFEVLQTTYITELTKNKENINKEIEDEIKKFARIGNYHKIRLQKAHDQVMDLGIDLKNQGEFINSIIDSFGTQGIESIINILFIKKLISEIEFHSLSLNISKILIDSPRTDIKIRALTKIRNLGSIKDVTFLEEKLDQEKDENLRRALYDAIKDLNRRA